MSASLVGSEMCIRDSLLGVPPRACRGARRRIGRRRRRRSGAHSVYCLLYTSDAADDCSV
eukprot:8258701-Alexandrium_andersonii.AAC.1